MAFGAADVAGEDAVFFEVFEEVCDVVFLAFDLEFDAAIGEVFDPAGDVEAHGDLLGGVAEADALDAAFVEDLFGGHLA